MKTIARIAVAGAVTATCAGLAATPAAAAAPAAAGDHRAAHHSTGTVFVSSDNLTGNTVVAYRRGADGTLDQTGVYPTGGLGGQLVGSVVDHTASQGALALDTEHHLLYSVNAGSDTITVFAVHGDRLVRLQTVGSGGSFPVSITFHDRQLFVLNARGGGSIQGYRRVGTHLVPEPSWHRDLGLDPTQTPEFVHTPGQISFTPDGSKLIVTTKAGGQSVDVFPVSAQGPSQHPVVTPDPGNVPFAVAFDERGRLLVAEAGPSAVATFTVHRDATLSLVARAATGQAATCWIVVADDRVFVSNAGSATLSGFEDRDGLLARLGETATDPGTVDAAASPDGRFLYVQTGAAGIVDEFSVGAGGALSRIGSVTVPGGVGGEGIAVG